ncbi:MAG: hypothetical protein DMG96_25855 [Acidobacteria bacterium]|nr:MAG: hypothetical protein DME87_14185 [Verrucomicrobiota bacterium]PYV72571.1 MAG: hypothetical protein DMG96_25855 [Acidobacteriota bacterium]
MSTRRSALIGRSMPISAQKTRATAEGGDRKGRFYKPLPKEFWRGGFTYRQIAREGSAAIYEQRWTGCAEPSVSYEVVRLRCRDGFHIGGRFVPTAEVYPGSEQWGELGWTFCNKELAFAKLWEIAASLNAPARVGQKRKRSRLEKSPT